MKKGILLVMALLFLAGWSFFPQIAQADLEGRIIKDLDLKATPLDIAPSGDGQYIFILTPGEILAYSVQAGKIVDQIPVDKDFDRITVSPRANLLTLTSSTKKSLQMMIFDVIQRIDITGLPFKGPSEAPVTVAVFTDYQ